MTISIKQASTICINTHLAVPVILSTGVTVTPTMTVGVIAGSVTVTVIVGVTVTPGIETELMPAVRQLLRNLQKSINDQCDYF